MLEFIKEYWVQIVFVCTFLLAILKYALAMIEATKCGLRNDILSIYDRCKEKRKITKYQLQSIKYSYEQYKVFKGNSFVEDIVRKVQDFEIID